MEHTENNQEKMLLYFILSSNKGKIKNITVNTWRISKKAVTIQVTALKTTLLNFLTHQSSLPEEKIQKVR
jgi:hypothetical protein